MVDTKQQRRVDRNKMIERFEGYRPDAYLDSEGIPTIGVGATSYEDGSPVKMGDSITQERSQELLDYHLDRATSRLREIDGYQKLPPNAKAAVDSFAFNAGPNFIDNDNDWGTMNRAIRAGDAQGVADAMPLYDNGGTPGLVRRRKEEAALATTPAMDPVDSTLANDRTRKFGQDAVLNGEPVKWGGKDYGWQSPESFNTIDPPTPEPPAGGGGIDFNPLNNLFGIFQ